jgi:hypothetical protein
MIVKYDKAGIEYGAAIPNSTVPKPKRNLKICRLSCRLEKSGAPPLPFFHRHPIRPLWVSFRPLAQWKCRKKRKDKVKNGQMLIRREEPGLIVFDHF